MDALGSRRSRGWLAGTQRAHPGGDRGTRRAAVEGGLRRIRELIGERRRYLEIQAW